MRMKFAVSICIILLALALANATLPTKEDIPPPTPPVYIGGLGGDYYLDGSELILNGTFEIREPVPINADIFGDYVKELNWTVEILDWEKVISTPFKTQTLQVRIVPRNAVKEYYGLSIIFNMVKDSWTYTAVAEIFIHIPGGEPWTFPLNNYTGYIIAENIPRDLYLPMKGIPLTVWFRPNVTGWYIMDLYGIVPATGAELGIWDVKRYLHAGEVYKLNYTFHPGSWGFEMLWYLRFKKGDGTLLEEKVIKMVGHCPGHDENYYPFKSYSGKCLPDVIIDGVVDIYDITAVCVAYDAVNGTERYWERADVNGDGIVDIYDLTAVCMFYGEHR